MYANRRNFRVLEEIGVEEHDGDVRFKSESGNMAVSCMCNASGHNYRNSSFIMDLDVAMGQIPRSIERISSFGIKWECSTMLIFFTQLKVAHKFNEKRHTFTRMNSDLIYTMKCIVIQNFDEYNILHVNTDIADALVILSPQSVPQRPARTLL